MHTCVSSEGLPDEELWVFVNRVETLYPKLELGINLGCGHRKGRFG
jgi:hypothetical protein